MLGIFCLRVAYIFGNYNLHAAVSWTMASAVADLEAGLQAMLNLKPPGVSGSRITSLTSLCLSNIQARSLMGHAMVESHTVY